MTRTERLRHEFVEYIPEKLEDGVLYFAYQFNTVVHLCCCGCGSEVVTPIAGTDWSITLHGETASLSPSIGNWSFECRSHYWIDHGRVRWAGQWSDAKIATGRRNDALAKKQQFEPEPSVEPVLVDIPDDVLDEAPGEVPDQVPDVVPDQVPDQVPVPEPTAEMTGEAVEEPGAEERTHDEPSAPTTLDEDPQPRRPSLARRSRSLVAAAFRRRSD